MEWREGNIAAASRLFDEAILVARQVGALSFELRAATDLAEFGQQTGRRDEHLNQLALVFDQFDTSLETADVARARALLTA